MPFALLTSPLAATRLAVLASTAVLALSIGGGPAFAQSRPPLPPPIQPAPPTSPVQPPASGSQPAAAPEAVWAVNFEAANLFAQPSEEAEAIVALRQHSYLQILGYEGEWARVLNPRSRETAFIRSDLLGPTDTPPSYIASPPPPTFQEVNLPARVIESAAVSFFPTPEPEAQMLTLTRNADIFIRDSVIGEDGEEWFRTTEGDYLPGTAIQFPPGPPRTFAGRWIDANLSFPVTLTAYEGDNPVMTTLAIKGVGQWPTPTGLFAIQRRVANETMNSESIGIPRFAPGGYYLTNVLFTQYFLGSGESIHYNYWSSVWGYAGSHGCLGLPYAESEFLWRWATIGTPVFIHY